MQEKMESLRMRYLIVGQSSADTAHRLGQTLEASSRLGTAHEDLVLWLGRMETELGSQDSQHGSHESPVSDSDSEKVQEAPGSGRPVASGQSHLEGHAWVGHARCGRRWHGVLCPSETDMADVSSTVPADPGGPARPLGQAG